MIYELLGIQNSNDPELELRAEERKAERHDVGCLELSSSGATLAGAASHYREILKLFPTDPVAKAMLRELSPSLQPEMPDEEIDE